MKISSGFTEKAVVVDGWVIQATRKVFKTVLRYQLCYLVDVQNSQFER